MRISKSIFCTVFLLSAVFAGGLNAFGQKGNVGEEIRVKFSRGKTSTIVSGKIKNFLEGPIYLVGVSANQTMSARLISASGDVEIIISTPGSKRGAFITRQEKSWSGTIGEAGDCQIIVNPKRDNFSYKIEISVR